MGALTDFFSDSDTAKSSPITEQLLDNLYKTESSRNPKAVNEKSGALGGYQFLPSTVDMLAKKGIKFDPMNEKEARQAAKTYLESLVDQNGGDVRKALAQYGGFVKQDPTDYVNKVLGDQPAKASTLSDFFADEQAPLPPTGAGGGRGSYAGFNPVEAAANNAPNEQIRVPQKPYVGNIWGKQTVANLLNLRNEAPAFAAKALDLVAGLPGAAGRQGDYWLRLAQGMKPEEASKTASEDFATAMQPVGSITQLSSNPAYENNAISSLMNLGGKVIEKGVVNPIVAATGANPTNVQEAVNTAALLAPVVGKGLGAVSKGLGEAGTQLREGFVPSVEAGSVGAAAVPTTETIRQAMTVATPELKREISSIPIDEVNLPTLQRHLEADTLPVPVRLTEGQATGDVVKLSNELNQRGKNPELAYRFNEQNKQLIGNLEKFREQAAPDATGSRSIDHGQAIIDAYKDLDQSLNKDIDSKYQALRDAAGGDFPVNAPELLDNIKATLKKDLVSSDAPASQMHELEQLAKQGSMTFENYLALRRNLSTVARTATDGNMRHAAGLMIEELEKLPLKDGAAELKPLADQARAAARQRFQMLERDPAYKASVEGKVAPEDFINKFVIGGKNEGIQQMLEQLGKDSVARQHMAAGTLSFLGDRAGVRDIYSGEGNFSQSGYNKALKSLDEANKLPLIFDGQTAEGLKTLGNVSRYTQAQPRGSFVNNSNTLVARMAEHAKHMVGSSVEKGLNLAVPGVQLGTSLMEARAARALRKETEQSLKAGAGIRQKKPSIMDLNKD